MKERHEFGTEDELERWMRSKGFGESYIGRTIEHEKSHFHSAVSKGYNAIYVMEKNNVEWRPSVEVEVRGDISIRDAISIALAPKNPDKIFLIKIP